MPYTCLPRIFFSCLLMLRMRDQTLATPTRHRDKPSQPTRLRPRMHRERSSSPLRRHPRVKRHRDSSPSPPRHSHHRSPSPPATHTPKRQRTGQGFRGGAGENRIRSACTLCLGRHPHDPKKCFSTTHWDGARVYCTRNDAGFLVNPQSQVLCTSWNQPHGCTSPDHPT
jgi:hypothetical protein